ncbi:MAG TPA: TonB family protein [Pyrinomonadaceae bacterium]|jgi:TonB family protein
MKFSIDTLILIFIFSLAAFAQTPTDGREKGVELYKQGNYKAAIKTLKDFTKQNSADYLAFHYLALAFSRENKLKDAEKTYEKAIKAKPDFAESHTGLAYIYLLRDKLPEAIKAAEKAVALDDGNPETFYILGNANLRSGKAEAAFENAERGIKLNPNLAGLHLLKAHAIMNISVANRNASRRSHQYGVASDSIGKFIILSKNLPDSAFWRGQQEALQFYAGYYAEREKNKSAAVVTNPDAVGTGENVLKTPVKILAKERAAYTDAARRAGVSGVVRLLVTFSEDGTIKYIIALNSLGYGLEEASIKAAKNIKFEPEKIDGKPVSAARTVEYRFTLY